MNYSGYHVPSTTEPIKLSYLFNYYSKLKGIFYCFHFQNKETEPQKNVDTFPRLTVGYTALQLVHIVVLDSPARFLSCLGYKQCFDIFILSTSGGHN